MKKILFFWVLLGLVCLGVANAELLRINEQNVIVDTDNRLMWQDKSTFGKKHADSQQICQNLVLNGFDDWRLPTVNELKMLMTEPSLLDSNCWTSNLKHYSNMDTAYVVAIHHNGLYVADHWVEHKEAYRCVRVSFP